MEAKKEEETKKPIISVSELNILEKKEHNGNPCYYHHFEDVKNNEKLDKPVKTDDYYKFDEEKNKELDSIFKEMKLKIDSSDKYGFLKNGKYYSVVDDTCKIYNEKMILKNEIKFESGYHISSVIELNNNDLIILSGIENPENNEENNEDDYHYHAEEDKGQFELLIYRMKDNNYILSQKIKENIHGYYVKYAISGMDDYPEAYYVLFIKEISGNRIFLASNYGFKIYSLNEKNEFVLTLKANHSETLKSITEINENKFIFCTDFSDSTVLGGPCYNEFIMEFIELEKITEEKLKENKIKALKYSEKSEEILYYTSHLIKHYFSDCLILKKKYFIILLDFVFILIFDFNGKQLKRYKISKNEQTKMDFLKFYERHVNIQKWDSNEENKFLYLIDNDVFLMELNDDEKENISLKIIGHSCFANGKYLFKINDQNNKFYSSYGKNNSIYLY